MPHIIYHTHLDEAGTDWDVTIYGPFENDQEARIFADTHLSTNHAEIEIHPLTSPESVL